MVKYQVVPRTYYRIRVTSAEPTLFLKQMVRQQILLENITFVDDLSLCFVIRKKDLSNLQLLCDRNGADLQIYEELGTLWRIQRITNRAVLVMGCVTLLLLSFIMPQRILFVVAEGNKTVSSAQIMDAAAECGLYFGVKRKEIRSEQVKNSILQLIPQLRWVGVNTRGCVAVITVSEKEREADKIPFPGISKIVALRDGVISSCTVTSGKPLCSNGQAVTQGQVLVSGISGSGILLDGCRSQAEIFGTTMRNVEAVMPEIRVQKGEILCTEKSISLILGKKRIIFDNSSRISGGICVKMYEEYYVRLPNGFRLPFGIAIEQRVYYEESVGTSLQQSDVSLINAVHDYLCSQMISGEIRSAVESVQEEDGAIRLNATYLCHELIGKELLEEMITDYGKDH